MKNNKKDTAPAPATAPALAPVPTAEEPATEIRVDEVYTETVMLAGADSNIQVKESKGTRKSRRNKKDTSPETAPAPNAEEPRAETAVDEVRYRSHALCNTDVEM